jgi:hypothetical protein
MDFLKETLMKFALSALLVIIATMFMVNAGPIAMLAFVILLYVYVWLQTRRIVKSLPPPEFPPERPVDRMFIAVT